LKLTYLKNKPKRLRWAHGERHPSLQAASRQSFNSGWKGQGYNVYLKLTVIDNVLIVSFKEL